MPGPRPHQGWRSFALSAALVLLALPLTSVAANASEPRASVVGLRPLPTSDAVVNRVISTSFDLALAQPHGAALADFIASLSDSASANYHHYLTPGQYAARFGATAATVTAVRTYLSGYGLTTTLDAGRNVLHVTGSTLAIARAFDARVETVRRSDGALGAVLANTGSLPRTIAKDVTAVAGLSSVKPETSNARVGHVATTPTACTSAGSSAGTTPNSVGGYTVQQQAELYGLDAAWAAGVTGVGQTIGVYELSSYDTSDASTFFSCYGIAPNVESVLVDGGPTGADNADNTPDEATLDVEETAALAPGATIEVYAGTQAGSGPTDVYTQIASDDTATIITTSWGICEDQTNGGAQVEQPIFEEMAAQGQTVISAAGDEGSSDCEGVETGAGASAPAVDDPSSQPYVTGVGGLTVSNILPLDEKVWNDGCTATDCGAGGGGVSDLWSRPSWQVAPGIDPSADMMRMVPDLSVMADPATGFIQYYTGTGAGTCTHSCSGGWGAIGGTSIGAPIVSALVAVAAQTCGVSRLGFINPSLYAMAQTGFVDVTSGSNDLFNVGVYSAGVGYDMASGLGSPSGAAFIAGLCPPSFSKSASNFDVSRATALAESTGPTVTATLRDVNGNPIPNASVEVNASAPGGLLSIDRVFQRANGLGKATSPVTSDINGVVSFTVGSSIAQRVAVSISYEGQTIYTTTLTFKAVAVQTHPGVPSIARLTPLVGGFSLTVRAPATTGGSAITFYQYSINAARSWVSFRRESRSVVVTGLVKGRAYVVQTRALNAFGASSSSVAQRVVTRS